jgi:hypothetical protein
MKKGLPRKPVWGPPLSAALNYPDARHHGFYQQKPGGSEPLRKYDGNSQIQTLLGAQPLDAQYRHGSRT